MRRNTRSLASLALAALLIGCAQLGTPAPQAFNQSVAAGIASVTAVRQSATVLLKGPPSVIASPDGRVAVSASGAPTSSRTAASLSALRPPMAQHRPLPAG